MDENGEQEIRALYHALIEAWNDRNAQAFAALIAETGCVVGFEGTPLAGRMEVEISLTHLFAHHPTPTYACLIREVEFPTRQVAWLNASVGVTPPGEIELDPALNAKQSMVAVIRNGRWEVEVLQNTPGTFHSEPDDVEKLIAELPDRKRRPFGLMAGQFVDPDDFDDPLPDDILRLFEGDIYPQL